MRKIILIGPTGSGKTTFTQGINNKKRKYKKTQSIERDKEIIDTPGEYIESRRFYNALITTSFDCEIIGLVHDCTRDECLFPPSFAAIFNKPVIGIVTKVDSEEKNLAYAEECLLDAGAEKIFKVSSLDGTGMDEIKKFLDIDSFTAEKGELQR